MNSKVVAALTGVGGLIVGVTTGFLISREIFKRAIPAIYEDAYSEAASEIDRLRARFKENEYASPEEAAKDLLPGNPEDWTKVDKIFVKGDGGRQDVIKAEEILKEEEYIPQDDIDKHFADTYGKLDDPGDHTEEVHNVFVEDDENAIPEGELENRSEEHPYVITLEEFEDSDLDFEKISVTYFEGDDTLSDERVQPIPDVEGTVGSSALTLFGKGSKDKNVVYVRNHHLEIDFEVVRDEQSYSDAVLGLKPQKRKSPRMGAEDD